MSVVHKIRDATPGKSLVAILVKTAQLLQIKNDFASTAEFIGAS